MNQDRDPIADREAKIAAWRKKARRCPWEAGEYLLTDEEIDEGVALMRSAPDGDAKLRELRDWACESLCDTDCGDAVRLPPLLREIDRLAALPAQQPEPKPDAATRDGDEVLRELAQWAGGEGTNELWRAVAELCRAELCRRELARGGK